MLDCYGREKDSPFLGIVTLSASTLYLLQGRFHPLHLYLLFVYTLLMIHTIYIQQ